MCYKNRLIKNLSFSLLAIFFIFSPALMAQVSSDVVSSFTSLPPVTTPSTPPLVMLAMSRDHELHKKAYTDYSDLDGDGSLDISYTDNFDYYGYFDNKFCYQYDSTNNRFSPLGQASGAHNHHCDDPAKGPWSGNFLNWATMTRIDVVRRVLYGGKRSTDSNGLTVLERSNLPDDTHAFAKVFTSNTDLRKYTPYTSSDVINDSLTLCNVSTSSTSNPEIRIAKGQWGRWSATEIVQCKWGNTTSSPAATNSLATLIAKVEVCKSGQDENDPSCKSYSNGNKKPIGLLQKYGEAGEIRFGLMTGSYSKSLTGGVLRKNIGKIAGNTTASLNELDTSTGIFTGNDGIIKTIDALRISQANYVQNSTQRYDDCRSPAITVAQVKSGSDANKQCRDWGNPIAEIYLEAVRYFSGAAVTAAFNTTDNNYISQLPATAVAWQDPMPSSEWCANCAIVLLSTGLNSFDTDDLASAANIPGMTGSASVNTATDLVGTLESSGSFAGSYLIGGSDGQCTPKTLSGLSAASGICPELPALEGGYQVAGLAHYARKSDLRTATGYPGRQSIDTYTVALSETLPSFKLSLNGGEITFLPFCQSNKDGGTPTVNDADWSICSMVNIDFESVQQVNGELVSGSMVIHWEDSLWGADYDLDGSSRLAFCKGSYCSPALANNQIKITTSAPHAYAGSALRFGYTITGTDGSVLYNGSSTPAQGGDGVNPERLVVRPGNSNFSTFTPTDNPTREPTPKEHIFTVGTTPAANLLKNPLYYAAKYGGFKDMDNSAAPGFDGNGNGSPDAGDNREWDTKDLNGNLQNGGDGIPDNYFPVRNPAQLEARLGTVFSTILGKLASGTAAAVVANSSTGTGAVYQALYHPLIENSGKQISWAGTIQALFIDGRGRLREDHPSLGTQGQLDDCSIDAVVEIFYDSVNPPFETKIRRYSNATANCVTLGAPVVLPLGELRLLWSANPLLARLNDVTTQRSYTTATNASTGGGRHILTATNGTVTDFDTTSIDSSNYTWLNVASETEADQIVRWVRGEEGISGYRSRTIEFDASHTGLEAWRLGDVVNSTPAVVGRPNANYDLLYSDASYTAFKTQYAGRRQVLYVGANDGMIHAFNGGFWDEANLAFSTSSGSNTAHPLGAELWSYVPENLLPHLKWLTDPSYPHVYYMDGSPKSYDVKIFANDATHPGGWGTILVVGMRLGGGAITVDTAGNGLGTPNNSDDRTLRSAYVVLDVTDPEQPPSLIAEISDPNLGLTTSEPALMKRVTLGVTPSYQWELLFGSGPTVLSSASSTQNARLYRYDLVSKTFVTGFAPLDLGISNSFVGDMRSVDWDLDYQDDAAYFGIASGTGASMSGRMSRLRLDNNQVYTLFDGAQPVVAAPMTATDGNGSRWVYFGTGKMFSTGDRSNSQAQAIYGIKEPLVSSAWTWGTVTASNLLDSNSVRVFTDGSVRKSDGTRLQIGTTWIDTFDQLKAKEQTLSGWKLSLPVNGSNPSTRVLHTGARIASLVLFTDHQPSLSSSCDIGVSHLHALHHQTGTALAYAPIGTDTTILNNSKPMAVSSLDLGPGISSMPVIHQGAGDDGITVITQQSTGSMTGSNVGLSPALQSRQSWLELDPAAVFK